MNPYDGIGDCGHPLPFSHEGKTWIRDDCPACFYEQRRGNMSELVPSDPLTGVRTPCNDGHMTTTKTDADTIRVYLPDTFIFDAWECDPDLWPLWEKIVALPTAKRGRGTGRWAELTPDEAKSIKAEADYRAEYWLTDAYGVENVEAYERTRGRAAQRVAAAIAEATR